MSPHFAAFSFVDRITELEPATRARGTFAVPAQHRRRSRRASSPKRSASSRPGWRWRTSTFAAGRSRRWPTKRASRGDAAPGRHARSRGRHRRLRRRGRRLSAARRTSTARRIDRARRLPRTDAAGRRVRFARARCASASRCCATAARRPDASAACSCPRDDRRAACRRVGDARRSTCPRRAPFFDDHFPRRPVFPATLLLDAQIELALAARRASRAPGRERADRVPVRMTHVKVRAFTPPGAAARAVDVDLRRPRRRRSRTRDAVGASADGQDRRAPRALELARKAGHDDAVKRRVAITGIGLVTPVGNDVATTWAALLAGSSGGAPITLFDASGFSTRIAAEVKDFDDARSSPTASCSSSPTARIASRSRRPSRRCATPASRPTDDDARRAGAARSAPA